MKTDLMPKRRRHRKPPPKIVHADTIAVVQFIGVAWDKDYRGGPGAAVRNDTPEAEPVRLPDHIVVEPSFLLDLWWHGFGYARGMLESHWSPGPRVRKLNDALDFGGVSVRYDEGKVHVDYAWNDDCGMPKRFPRKDVLLLEKGEWGRLRFNERHSQFFTVYGWDSSEWWYEKLVLNVGLFEEFDPAVFVGTAPTKVVSMMDQLW